MLVTLRKIETKTIQIKETGSDDSWNKDVALKNIVQSEKLLDNLSSENQEINEVLRICLKENESLLKQMNSQQAVSLSEIRTNAKNLFKVLDKINENEPVQKVKTNKDGRITGYHKYPVHNGKMPALLLAPYRIFGLVLQRLGVFTMVILSMFVV